MLTLSMPCPSCKNAIPLDGLVSGSQYNLTCQRCGANVSGQMGTITPRRPRQNEKRVPGLPVGNEQHCLDTAEWKEDCMKWRGRVLTGKESHWCFGWDGLPVDETTPEWPCECAVLVDE